MEVMAEKEEFVVWRDGQILVPFPSHSMKAGHRTFTIIFS